jgi:4-aminobutyrate aminotransferase-like enzyme
MTETLADRRLRLMGPNVPTFYRRPLHIVRGQGCWLWDADGRRYLDAYNNVPHVGHCHPRVVQAIATQAATLNTHTRYLHEGVLHYIERLTATMGHGLTQAIMTCTGSEANDVALRMVQAATGRTGLIATDNTYHGNTQAVSQLNTRRLPIGARWPNVRLVPAPDALIPPAGPAGDAADRFAAHVAAAVADLQAAGHGVAGMILCPVFANEGLPAVPPGFLNPAAAVLRGAGGLLIADEVQPGFGRVAPHFWGYQRLGIAPDVVTLGKPMANGHPVGAVVARPAVLAAFREAFGYFNTFAGNPVSAAACHAVLDVIADEGLVDHAQRVASHVTDRLQALRHPWLAGVRGAGLFFAAEFVDDRGQPVAAFAEALVEAMLDRGVLVNRLGRGGNVLKIRPPMVLGLDQADILCDALQAALAETSA